mmetsp:Transcript_6350/g.19192  ORF Transcript_6350/g.19192 Transcript_6350/m.19192 type:complete len:325 (+) Transcript_6350:3-977(+)
MDGVSVARIAEDAGKAQQSTMEPDVALAERRWQSGWVNETAMHKQIPAGLFEVQVGADGPTETPLNEVVAEAAAVQRVPSRGHIEEFALALIKKMELKLCNKEVELCGFSKTARHEAVTLNCEDHVAEKTGKGLYRSVRTCRGLSMRHLRKVYFEFHVLSQPNKSGLCIGLAKAGSPLDKMVGLASDQIGLYSTGQLVSGNKWTVYGREYGAGDTVGCSLSFQEQLADDPDERGDGDISSPKSVTDNVLSKKVLAHLEYSVNGESFGRSSFDFGASPDTEILPTVSLLVRGTKVAIRCCPADQRYAPSTLSASLCGTPFSHSSP